MKITISNLQAHKKGRTNVQKVQAITDEQIKRTALTDREAPLLSENELKQFKPLKLFRYKLTL